jgi:putative sigma-54 modulation protein
MEKIFKHEEKIIRARIELEHDSKSSSHKNEYIAKGHLELKGTTITISTASDNINKSVDDLIEKLDRGLRRRSRLKRVKRKQGSLNDLPQAA